MRAAPVLPANLPDEIVLGGWHAVPLEREVAGALLEAQRLDGEGRRREAILVLNDELATVPDSAGLHEARGALCAAVGFLRGAAAEFERVTELSPERGPAWAALGRMRQELGLATGAIAALERAHELGADGARMHLSWARALRRKRARGEAARHYLQVLDHTDDPATELLIEAASLYYEAHAAESGPLEQACKQLGIDANGLQGSLVRALLEERGTSAGVGTTYRRATRVDREALASWTRAVLLAVHLAGSDGPPRSPGPQPTR